MRIVKYIAFGIVSLLIPTLFVLLFIELEKKKDDTITVLTKPIDQSFINDKLASIQSEIIELKKEIIEKSNEIEQIDVNLPRLPDIKVEIPQNQQRYPNGSVAPHISRDVIEGSLEELKQLVSCKICLSKSISQIDSSLTRFNEQNSNSNISIYGLIQDCREFNSLKKKSFSLIKNAETIIKKNASDISAGSDFNLLHGRLMEAIKEFQFQCDILNDELSRVRANIPEITQNGSSNKRYTSIVTRTDILNQLKLCCGIDESSL